jgi:DNA-directed RNA polymerase subunit M/transcription elongation factor TFIIS
LPKKRKEEKWVKFCPKCGSTNIQWASGLPQLWSVWECKSCGYRGAFIVEDSDLAERIRESFSKQLKHDEGHIHDREHVSEA